MSTAEASSVTDTTATLNGSVAFNWSTTNSTGFKWGYEPDLSDEIDVAGDTLAGDFSADLTGLVPNTRVYFVAYSTNALGTSYGDTLSCFPLVCGPVEFDGYTYETVAIDSQCWFAENLRTTVYADGSAIPEVTNEGAWAATTDGARCSYNNDPDNEEAYGLLYNWYAVDSAAGLCPTGWHVPTDEEFNALTVIVGGWENGGLKLKSSAADQPSWNGTNSSGWSGLAGGRRKTYSLFAPFSDFGEQGFWWSSSESGTNAWYRLLDDWSENVLRFTISQKYGLSVRCLQDSD